MRFQRLRFEFRVELASQEEGMVRQFDDLDIGAVGRRSTDAQSRSGERSLVFAIEFVAMAVTLADLGLLVSLVGQGAGFDLASPSAQSHGAAQLLHAAQFTQFV